MDPAEFYDTLAQDYHLIFQQDWWTVATWQGSILAPLLRSAGAESVLDCTCGIGTQALPLAEQGFRVIGSDISDESVARARREADERGIDVRLFTADVRTVAIDEQVDAVVSCDNSLPHLLTDSDLNRALVSIRRCLKPGGFFLASIRDYEALAQQEVQGVPPKVDDQRITGQAWRWAEDRHTVEINLFVLRRQETDWHTTVVTTTYRALTRDELTKALQQAGFEDVQWPDTGYYQPIVTARHAG
jgi:glycine/sarcosine N-methyltransferase